MLGAAWLRTGRAGDAGRGWQSWGQLVEPAECYHLLEAGKEGDLLWERVCARKP